MEITLHKNVGRVGADLHFQRVFHIPSSFTGITAVNSRDFNPID